MVGYNISDAEEQEVKDVTTDALGQMPGAVFAVLIRSCELLGKQWLVGIHWEVEEGVAVITWKTCPHLPPEATCLMCLPDRASAGSCQSSAGGQASSPMGVAPVHFPLLLFPTSKPVK